MESVQNSAVDRETQRDHAHHTHEVQVTTRILPDGKEVSFKIDRLFTLGDILRKGAEEAHQHLLPNAEKPLDLLRNIYDHHLTLSEPVDLDELVGEYLKKPRTTHNFGIELVRAFRVNARWDVAPSEHMTPRQILALPHINLDPSEFTLYHHDSSDVLPLDTPIKVNRGEKFDAQKDGKYGGTS